MYTQAYSGCNFVIAMNELTPGLNPTPEDLGDNNSLKGESFIVNVHSQPRKAIEKFEDLLELADNLELDVLFVSPQAQTVATPDSSDENLSPFVDYNTFIARSFDEINLAIVSEDWLEARKKISELRTQILEPAELLAIAHKVSLIPETERPVQVPNSSYSKIHSPHMYVGTMNYLFNVQIEAMTKDEFIEFMDKVVTGGFDQEGPGITFSVHSLAEIFGVDKKTCEDLLVKCINARIPRVIGQDAEHPSVQLQVDNIATAIVQLGLSGTPTSAEALFTKLYEFIDFKLYVPAGGLGATVPKERRAYFLEAVCEAICENKEIIPMEMLKENRDQLADALSKIRKYGDEPNAKKLLHEVLDHIKQN